MENLYNCRYNYWKSWKHCGKRRNSLFFEQFLRLSLCFQKLSERDCEKGFIFMRRKINEQNKHFYITMDHCSKFFFFQDPLRKLTLYQTHSSTADDCWKHCDKWRNCSWWAMLSPELRNLICHANHNNWLSGQVS